METTLAQKAVNFALSGDWEKALEVNKEILLEFPNDIEALNRKARCLYELGQADEATETSKKVLEIDPVNSIALKCLGKWKNAKPDKSNFADPRVAELFLEESGKTKIVPLLNLGGMDVLANLYSGQEVKLSAYSHKVSVTDAEGKYIGRLPDDLSARLKNLLKNGSKYIVLIKSIDPKNTSVFIRELENETGITSFPPEKIDYVTFTPPELVHKDAPASTAPEELTEV